MFAKDLLPDIPGLRVLDLRPESEDIVVKVEATSSFAHCPQCNHSSSRVHSRYIRTLTGFPCAGRQMVFHVVVRRFRCQSPNCERTVFAESIDDLAPARARTTGELIEAHTAIGFAAGGEPGARLADSLGMPTSPDTLLRRVRAAEQEPGPPPRYVGLDDWACKKGHRYGTIVIDLERQRVVELLPGRDGEVLTEWLRKNPQVEVVTRDRWRAYARAAREAVPQAKQVADRWHLLKNLREAVENMFTRLGPKVRAAAMPDEPPTLSGDNAQSAPKSRSAEASAREAKRQARRQRRQRVRDLRDQQLPVREIARRLRMSRKTVLDALNDPDRPHGRYGRRGPSALNAFDAEIKAWIAGGGTNTADLYRLLKSKGCRASYDAVRRYANQLIGSSGKPGRRSSSTPRPQLPKEPPSARRLSFRLLCPKKPTEAGDDTTQGSSLLERLRGSIPELGDALQVAIDFAAVIRKTLTQPLSVWLARATACGAPELSNFASSVRNDEAAVNEALCLPSRNDVLSRCAISSPS